jgi:phosphomannomutase
MEKIKFGTDGWRAIIAQEFTVDNVARVAEAVARWMIWKDMQSGVVLGHDNRFGGELFAEVMAKVLAKHGIKVHLARGFVSTPMVSLGTVVKNMDLGIIITASHNPPDYNGIKLKGPYGGPLVPSKVEEIEQLIPDKNDHRLKDLSFEDYIHKGLIEFIDLETMYCDHIENNFDLNLIRNSKLRFAYDAMFGAGQNVINRLLPNTALLHCDNNPSFNGQAPEPIDKNLKEFSGLIKTFRNIDCGLATDGDADRIGLFDSKGNFVDSNHIILLLINYLCREKRMTGKVVTSFSVSEKVRRMCEYFKLEHEVTKIGFKHIAGLMVTDDVLIGGEESGGIAIKGHIPERDGIWIGLTIWEYMASSGKSLEQLIKDVYAIVGPMSFERLDVHIENELKEQIMQNCKNNKYKKFGDHKVHKVETMDGFKYFFNDDEWLLIRASGTEPLLRNYIETSSARRTASIIQAVQETLYSSELPDKNIRHLRFLEDDKELPHDAAG